MNTCRWNYNDFILGEDCIGLEDLIHLLPIEDIGEDIVDMYIENDRQGFYHEWWEYMSEWEDWGFME